MSEATEKKTPLQQLFKEMDVPVTASTARHWCQDGVNVAGVGKVKLEAERIGRRFFTTRKAIQKFLELMNGSSK